MYTHTQHSHTSSYLKRHELRTGKPSWQAEVEGKAWYRKYDMAGCGIISRDQTWRPLPKCLVWRPFTNLPEVWIWRWKHSPSAALGPGTEDLYTCRFQLLLFQYNPEKSMIYIHMQHWILHVSLVYQTTPSPALDVLHHQRGEGRVWPLLHCFCDTEECMWLGNVHNSL